MVLEQQPQQLPAACLQVLLELVVGPAADLGACKGGGQRLEGGTGASKGVLGQPAQHSVVAGVVVVGLHRALSRRFGPSTRNLRGGAPHLHLHLDQAAPTAWHTCLARSGPASASTSATSR